MSDEAKKFITTALCKVRPARGMMCAVPQAVDAGESAPVQCRPGLAVPMACRAVTGQVTEAVGSGSTLSLHLHLHPLSLHLHPWPVRARPPSREHTGSTLPFQSRPAIALGP